MMLSWFASDFFAKSPVLVAPLIAMAIFASVFLFYALRALFLGREQVHYLHALPLAHDDRPQAHNDGTQGGRHSARQEVGRKGGTSWHT